MRKRVLPSGLFSGRIVCLSLSVTIPAPKLVPVLRNVMTQLPETRTIFFHDDNACHDTTNTRAWCRTWIDEGAAVTFVATSRINHFDSETLDVMQRAGFRKVAVGINLMLCQPEATIDDVKATAEFCLRVLGETERENTVSVSPFIRAYAGSWYFDNWDLIEYRYATIPSNRGTKSETIRVP